MIILLVLGYLFIGIILSFIIGVLSDIDEPDMLGLIIFLWPVALFITLFGWLGVLVGWLISLVI